MKSDDESPPNLAASPNLFTRRDRENVRNYASFVWGSGRRHRVLVVAVFLTIVGATVGTLLVLPRTYHVETKALVQTNSALVVRGDGPGADSLTRVAAETVLRQDNLVALIQQTDLLRYTSEHRAPLARARDAIAKALHVKEDSESDRIDGMVKLLEKKFSVWTSESGSTVSIAIDWNDALMACRLVDAAQRTFLDARYASEVTALAEAIGILQSHTINLKADIDEAVSGIERMRGGKDAPKSGLGGPPPPPPQPRMLPLLRPAAARVSAPNADLQQLKSQLEVKQRALSDLEESRRHRLLDLQGRLAEARTTYTDNHPIIVDLKQSIVATSVESPQATSLRQEAASLKNEYDRRSVVASDTPASLTGSPSFPNSLVAGAVATPPQLPSDVLRLDLDLREDRDPGMVYARGQLRDAMDKYAALRSQIQTGQIDLETAQAAFKYRYSVVSPAHLPRSPTTPNVPLIFLAALVAALFSSLLLAVMADVRAGRLLEPWQIERLLDRPILGEIVLPTLAGPDFE